MPFSGKARKMTHSRPAQGATYTAKAAHVHERTVIMSFKVIRATAPELAVQMVGGAHPTARYAPANGFDMGLAHEVQS
jgi:hypothetical protein